MGKHDIFRRWLIDEGIDLEPGMTLNGLVCPKCKGGDHNDKVFSVTRFQNGYKFNCYRAKCRFSGVYTQEGGGYVREAVTQPRFTAKTYPWKTVPLSAVQRSWFTNRFSLSEVEVDRAGIKYCPERDSYAYPIRDIRGNEVGIVDRTYAELGNNRKPKSISYWFQDVPKFYWPSMELFRSPVVLVVEDIVSAIKGARYVDTIALLGAHLSDNGAAVLSGLYDRLLMGLDRDAAVRGIRLAKEYNLFFKEASAVLVVPKDLKDMTNDELGKLLGGYDGQRHNELHSSGS